jgi:hypothetical protein
VQDAIGTARDDARGVEVFHAQQPTPVVMAGVEVAAEGCNQRSEMQVAGG